jgi:hypothetical protein
MVCMWGIVIFWGIAHANCPTSCSKKTNEFGGDKKRKCQESLMDKFLFQRKILCSVSSMTLGRGGEE